MLTNPVRLILITAMLIFTLAACDTSPDDHLKRAEQFHVDKNYRSAIIELKALLQQDPNNVQGRWLLGRVYLDTENGAAAEKELRRARALGVVDDSLLPLLAQALNLQGEADQVLALTSEGPLSPQSTAELDAYRGLAHLKNGDIAEAEKLINAAVAAAPDSVAALFARAQLLEKERKFKEAKAVIQSIHERDPTHGLSWSLLGDIELAENAYPEAEAAFAKAMQTRWNTVIDQTKRGLARIGQKNIKGADEDLTVLLQKAPNIPFVQYFAGVVRFNQQNFPAAVDALEAAYGKASDHLQTVFLLASAHYRVGNIARARDLAERAFAQVPSFVPVRKLLASIYLQQGQPEKAEEILRPVVAALPDDLQAKDALASSYIRQGKAKEAAKLLQEVADRRQDQPAAQLRAGIGFLSTGQQAKGVETLRHATELAPKNDAVNTMAVTTLMQAKMSAEAVDLAKAFAEHNADDAAAHNLLGVAHLANSQKDEARQAFERALALSPGNPAASENLATLALTDKDPGSARAYLEGAIERNPGNARLLYRMGTLALTEEKRDEAKGLFRQALEHDPKLLNAQVDLARLLLDEGDARQAVALLSTAPGQNPQVLSVRADAYVQTGQYADAKRALEGLRDQQPNSLDVQLRLARVYAELGDKAGLSAALDRVLALQPGHPQISLIKARLLALDGRYDEAEQLLSKLDVTPNDASVLEARYFVRRAQQDAAGALTIAKEIFESRPATATALQLSAAYERSGDTDRAAQILTDWTAKRPHDAPAIIVLSELNVRRGREAEAVKALEQVVTEDPANIAALNNLAWYLREQQPQKALGYAKKAYQLAPASGLVLDTYAEVLARNGEGDLALRAIDRAIAAAQDKSGLRLRRAEILFLLGERERAVKEAQEVAAGGEGQASSKARALLKSWGA